MTTTHQSTADRRGRSDPSPVHARGLGRTLGIWCLVVAAAALSLRVADALPRLALGLPRGVVLVQDIDQLERRSGRPMPVPAYYPDVIEWPPSENRISTNGCAAIWCRQRPAGGVMLIVATAPPGLPGIAPAVLPAAVELQREDTAVSGHEAAISRVRDVEGAVWQQVQWQGSGQIILVRYRGTLDELMKIAGSMHE